MGESLDGLWKRNVPTVLIKTGNLQWLPATSFAGITVEMCLDNADAVTDGYPLYLGHPPSKGNRFLKDRCRLTVV